MALERKPESRLAEATQRTTTALQDLQSRLRRETNSTAAEEPPSDLGKQLEEYFATAPSPAPRDRDEIRDRVIEGVAGRILKEWEETQGELSESFKSEVIERLMERVLERLGRGPAPR